MNITKRFCLFVTVAVMCALVLSVFAFAGNADETTELTGFDKVTAPIIDLIDSLLGPLLGIVGALGAIYCVFLGVKFAKAEEPQDREKAKNHLKNAIIGFVLIFVLMLALKLLMPVLTDWVAANE